MSSHETIHVPQVTIERFESFRSAHGAIESPFAERILADFFTRAIAAAFEAKRMGSGGFKSISSYVLDEFARNSADILEVLELAAQWAADPLKAAEAQLRPALEAKAKAQGEEAKRRQEAELRAEVQRRTEELLSGLKTPASAQGK